jgi:hypothetical protein
VDTEDPKFPVLATVIAEPILAAPVTLMAPQVFKLPAVDSVEASCTGPETDRLEAKKTSDADSGPPSLVAHLTDKLEETVADPKTDKSDPNIPTPAAEKDPVK